MGRDSKKKLNVEPVWGDHGLSKALPRQPREILPLQLDFPLSFTSFFRLYKHTYEQKNNTDNTQCDSQWHRKFLKEGACQSHGQGSVVRGQSSVVHRQQDGHPVRCTLYAKPIPVNDELSSAGSVSGSGQYTLLSQPLKEQRLWQVSSPRSFTSSKNRFCYIADCLRNKLTTFFTNNFHTSYYTTPSSGSKWTGVRGQKFPKLTDDVDNPKTPPLKKGEKGGFREFKSPLTPLF